MGVKTKISLKDLPKKYQKYNLIKTKDGISQSVYLLGDKYVLKIYGKKDSNIKQEIKLLKSISGLNNIQVVKQIKIRKKHSIIYKQISGKAIYSPKKRHIKQIARFLKKFHNETKNKSVKSKKLLTKSDLKKIAYKRGNKVIQNYLKSLKITLRNDGIIHSDIFPDNVLFKNNRLKAVVDFSEACDGDFLFEIAVVAISWCFNKKRLNKKKLNTLIKNYDKKIDKKVLKNYMKYALIYFAIIRLKKGGNYLEMLERLKSL